MTRAFFLLLAIFVLASSGQSAVTTVDTRIDCWGFKVFAAAPPPSSSALRTLATLKTVKASVSAGSFGFL